MNVDNLRLFRDIALTRSVSRSAEMNGITPSAASQHVTELERSLGVSLLDRSTRPLSLTAEGLLYSELCRDVLHRREEFDAELDSLRTRIEGSVRIAAIYSIGLSDMSALETEFARRLPNVRLNLDYLRPEKVYEAVESDRADIGLVSYPEPSREIAVVPWREEEMVLAALPSNPLLHKKFIEPSDLNGADFVICDVDLPIGRELIRYLRTHNVVVNRTMHFDNLQTIKEAVLLGSGVSIVPGRILKTELTQGRLGAVPLVPKLFRPLGIIHRKRKRFSRAGQALLDLLLESSHTETLVVAS